ncbi:PapF family fimbrial adapter [Buttiauxella ferragutiae ATCC 51602]|uniref:PapF family fimbrial adapter n=2 Tax=Buttiauxella ferragutiae TaxID=82989 RepID=A0ABX2W6B4_9ENTR|nr:PapF family fimbrial adapter [Buttiauxella ferragutiae ATCC 51602]
MVMKTRQIASALLLAGILFSATTARANINITITSEIYIPPCVVNGDTLITVDFGDMDAQKVDGQAYAKSITVPVSCTYYSGAAYVRVTGSQLTGAPTNVLKTDATGGNADILGVALYQGNGVNSSFPLTLGGGSNGYGYPLTQGWTGNGTASSQFTLTAVPYKQGGSLEAGAFSATATMSISYL